MGFVKFSEKTDVGHDQCLSFAGYGIFLSKFGTLVIANVSFFAFSRHSSRPTSISSKTLDVRQAQCLFLLGFRTLVATNVHFFAELGHWAGPTSFFSWIRDIGRGQCLFSRILRHWSGPTSENGKEKDIRRDQCSGLNILWTLIAINVSFLRIDGH